MAMNKNGLLIYEGPSMLTHEPIVMIATGFTNPSANRKTGPAIQFYIIRSDMDPVEAYNKSQDNAICGECPAKKWCYVNLGRDVKGIYECYARGGYGSLRGRIELFKNKCLRFGAYGDPAAVPLHVWRLILTQSTNIMGYTHQWRDCSPEYSSFCMASVETEQDYLDAKSLGYRTFRATDDVTKRLSNEAICAYESAGIQCTDCGACNGHQDSRKGDIVVTAHGTKVKHFLEYMDNDRSK